METVLGLAAAIGTAIAKSATDLGTKFATAALEERPLLALQWSIGAIVLSLACLVWYPALMTHPVSTFISLIGENFWWVLVLDGGLNAIAFYFYVRAFRFGDASLVAPIMLFTPIFLLVTSPLILGERIPPIGIVGVLTTVVGAYFLGKSLGTGALWESLKALARNTGVQSMFITAAIWSVTSNLDKIGVRSATPLLWSASISLVIALYSILFWIVMPKRKIGTRGTWRASVPGVTNALGTVLQMYALTVLFVPYVIAIKRVSSVLTVLASGVLFGERTKERLAGVIIMLLGTALMALGS